jgi:hypothetical protein
MNPDLLKSLTLDICEPFPNTRDLFVLVKITIENSIYEMRRPNGKAMV